MIFPMFLDCPWKIVRIRFKLTEKVVLTKIMIFCYNNKEKMISVHKRRVRHKCTRKAIILFMDQTDLV
jgi:hypothetical protein